MVVGLQQLKKIFVAGFFSAWLLCSSAFASPVLKDANGEVIGAFLGYNPPFGPNTSTVEGIADFVIMSRTGYIFLLVYGTLNIFETVAVIRNYGEHNLSYKTDIFFETTDCSGDAFVNGVQSGIIANAILNLQSIYDNAFLGSTLYYVPKGAAVIPRRPQSRLQVTSSTELGCQELPLGSSRLTVKALPNDPAVTGISNWYFPLPVYFDFDYRFGTPEVFADQFLTVQE